MSLWKVLWKSNSCQEHTALWKKYIRTFQLYSLYFDGPYVSRILFICDYLKYPFPQWTVLCRDMKVIKPPASLTARPWAVTAAAVALHRVLDGTSLLDCWILQDGIERLTRNIGNQLPVCTESVATRVQNSFTLQRNPGITHKLWINVVLIEINRCGQLSCIHRVLRVGLNERPLVDMLGM